jgi:hypothetical protein
VGTGGRLDGVRVGSQLARVVEAILALVPNVNTARNGPLPVSRGRATRATGGFIRRLRLDGGAATAGYPFTLPIVAWLARSGRAGPRAGGDVSGG